MKNERYDRREAIEEMSPYGRYINAPLKRKMLLERAPSESPRSSVHLHRTLLQTPHV